MTRPAGAADGAAGTDGVAAALLDGHGRIVWWSGAATELLGWTGEEVAGNPARHYIADAAPPDRRQGPPGGGRTMRLRHRSGHVVDAEMRLVRPDSAPGVLVLAMASGESGGGLDQDRNLGRALLTQEGVAFAQFGMDLRPVRTNEPFEELRPESAEGEWLSDLVNVRDGTSARDLLSQVAETGAMVVGAEFRPASDEAPVTLSLTCFRVEDPLGMPVALAVVASEVTERRSSRRRLTEAYRRAIDIGASLDMVQVAQDLVEVLVPALGDMATVDFPDDVLQGRDPPLGEAGPQGAAARRTAAKSAHGPWPPQLLQPGELLPRVTEHRETAPRTVGGVVLTDGELSRDILGRDPELMTRLVPDGLRYSLGCPLYRRGRLFGYANVYRTGDSAPYDEADTKLMRDLCARTALAIDNAFRFNREHRTAVVLQRSLLPPAATDSAAAETAGAYVPAGGSVSVGGDWFDAVPMSSLRIGLVVGDVVGHGLPASASMARLRTAVQTLADLDLPPDELLTRLDDLVLRMKGEAEDPDGVGGSCLFAVYDPVTRVCEMASAGHPPPAVVLPDGSVYFAPLVPGPPLGVGDNPFEVCSLSLPPGSVLALYTDGLVGEHRDPEQGMERLRENLRELCRSDRSLERIGADLIARRPEAQNPPDDVTLLLARTRAVPEGHLATWEYPAEPAAVQRARADVDGQLAEWGLDELRFSTELLVSELVTNAVRYAGSGPLTLRLIRDRGLVCEVSDPSNTQPRLRRARSTDEGGRGLFLVAQLSERWGCRYRARGKTIWTEQSIDDPAGE